MLAEHQIPRHMERMRTLSAAIAKQESRIQKVRDGLETRWSEEELLARIEGYRAEMSERRARLLEQKAVIDAALS